MAIHTDTLRIINNLSPPVIWQYPKIWGMSIPFFILFFFFIIMPKAKHDTKEATIKSIVEFIENHEWKFVYGDYWDYIVNIKILWDIIQNQSWWWYLEELHVPECDWGSEFVCADYYDSILNDVIAFDTDIMWRFYESPKEVAEYMYNLNERYEDSRKKYESMYTAYQCIQKILSLFKH